MPLTTLSKYRDERSISLETLAHFGLTELEDTVGIPYGRATKFRRGWEPGERKFWWDDEVRDPLFNMREADRPTVFVTEGESDAMRLWQEIPDHEKVGVVAISGADGFSESAGDVLRRSNGMVYVILDNDVGDYSAASQTSRAFSRIRNAVPGARRVVLPEGTKDICEFFDGYNLEAFKLLLGQAVRSRFKPLDLRGPAPPTQWLVRGLVAQGDVHLLFGEPTVGKSWLTLDLAVAVAEGRSEWIGHPLEGGAGRVLYVDEENPADVILQRLSLLGLGDGASNVRFLHHPGIRLDRDPMELLEEAKDYEPRLIVLDSLTRLHTGEEDKAGPVAKLFNDGIIPLAHETGAAVILIHHAGKGDSNSSYRRARGSGDIIGASDTAFDIRAEGDDSVGLIVAKSRRVPLGRIATVKRVITPDSAKLIIQETPF